MPLKMYKVAGNRLQGVGMSFNNLQARKSTQLLTSWGYFELENNRTKEKARKTLLKGRLPVR